jgi:glycosyltransferase involved in cell wall biosynthesis
MGLPARGQPSYLVFRVLFLHQNFPGQFKHLAPALATRGHDIRALRSGSREDVTCWSDISVYSYRPTRSSTLSAHPWVIDYESKLIRGEAVFLFLSKLRDQGYCPDLVLAHPGWGESLFVKDVWPTTKLAVYCEFYYLLNGGDVGFDPEFKDPSLDAAPRLHVKNLVNLQTFESADAAISPTQWQASTFPQRFREKIRVIHDGIDTDAIRPDPEAWIDLVRPAQGDSEAAEFKLTRAHRVVTFVNRNLEPLRGYHIFMRALPRILKEDAAVVVLIVGGADVSYGVKPKNAKNWKEYFAREIRPALNEQQWGRIHFLGNVPYNSFRSVLALSTVHVYWTYPFVLSWSLLEAMSTECCVVASDTAPLQEVIEHGKDGILVDFFDVDALSNSVLTLLADPCRREAIGKSARKKVQAQFDLKRVCLPAQIEWVESLLPQH